MYFRIYKSLNVLLWMIPCRKKSIGETVVNTPFDQVYRHVRVVERLCFCLTLINIHHCLYNCYIHICYKYCLNECFYLVYKLKNIIMNFWNVA